jgi:hypothetical protein
MDWVEKVVAVDKIVTTKFKNDDPSQVCVASTACCPYPQQTVYDGKWVLMMRPVGTARLGANN